MYQINMFSQHFPSCCSLGIFVKKIFFSWANRGCLGNSHCFSPISPELRDFFHVLKNHISGARFPSQFRSEQSKQKRKWHHRTLSRDFFVLKLVGGSFEALFFHVDSFAFGGGD